LKDKERKLEELLKGMAPAVIAFSGGVDSSYLVCKAYEVLGDRALAVMAGSASVPSHQYRMADRIIKQVGIPFRKIRSHELELEEYKANPANRCYYCKNELFNRLGTIAEEYQSATILDGFNADDLGDFRPGRKAGEEHRVRSPLMEAGLTKADIRELSRRAHLPTADLPASACLASRFPYGVTITEEKLRMVDEGEEFLREAGFRVFRVRHHDSLVRLEFGPDDLKRALDATVARTLAMRFKKLGYKFITLDLEGYRTGSANEVLSPEQTSGFEA
jgi:pyridinium-3,5-biscarboxylic acid mononucleotide sulfurtransferase